MRRAPPHRYQTFPTRPPETPPADRRRRRRSSSASASSPSPSPSSSPSSSARRDKTPLPVRQLLLLALSLAEQTALNSISPYLPAMVSAMPGVPAGQGGLRVGLASAFALAQLSTNLLWGWASDLVGRKPVLLAGTASLAACFAAFGLCRRYWHVVVVHVAMGLLNGNAACVPTVLGELTDRSNQRDAFAYLPAIYSLVAITGPALGGLLVGGLFGPARPYLAPNLVAAALLALAVAVLALCFRETLDQTGLGPWRPRWLRRRARTARRPRRPRSRDGGSRRPLLSLPSSSSPPPPYVDGDGRDAHDPRPRRRRSAVAVDDDELDGFAAPKSGREPAWRDLLNRTTVTLLATYLVFQLSNINFNSLYPIFAAAPPPTGRRLGPGNIGVSLSLAGLATVVFQAFLYRPLQARTANLGTYRLALLGIPLSMALMPWVGYLDDDAPLGLGTDRLWLYLELVAVLVLKSVCAVGGLSSVMLLVVPSSPLLPSLAAAGEPLTSIRQITNSAPSHASLGTLNGVAQTLSALGHSFGPFVSGGLFTLTVDVRPKGEALAWSVFGGLALVGWLGSMFIRGAGLESDGWDDGGGEHGQPDPRRGSV